MLSAFDADRREAKRQLRTFEDFLHRNQHFSEKEGVTLLRALPHLCCQVFAALPAPSAHMRPGVKPPSPTHHGFEVRLGLDFKADYIVGDQNHGHFTFIEFEGGGKNDVFKVARDGQRARDWASPAQRGFSQISDWSWKIDDLRRSKDFEKDFGSRDLVAQYLVVCGRSADLDETDAERLVWRSTRTLVNSSPVRFWTYDVFVRQLADTLAAL
jgi:hypothetical protein